MRGKTRTAPPEIFRERFFHALNRVERRKSMTVFSYIVTATGAATLAALFVRLLDRIDRPGKR